MQIRNLLCALALVGLISAARADDDNDIVRVEEDWSLEVNEPDSETSSPQIATQMNPHHDYQEAYALYCVNYREIPNFWGGGMEIQLWEGESVLDIDAASGYELGQVGETIRWTQVLEVKNGKIAFSVKNGESSSFGAFGGDSLRVEQNTGMTNLNHYTTDDSVKYSGVSLGANRVKMLEIREVRRYKKDGTVAKDEDHRVVYDQNAGSVDDTSTEGSTDE